MAFVLAAWIGRMPASGRLNPSVISRTRACRVIKMDDYLRVVHKRVSGYDAKSKDYDDCCILVAEDLDGLLVGVVNVVMNPRLKMPRLKEPQSAEE